MNLSYYDNVFKNNQGHQILNELAGALSPDFKFNFPDLDVNEKIDAPFFRLGSQNFSKTIPSDKTSRLVIGDIKTQDGHPIGFSVGMALLCLYASNYNSSTREHLNVAVTDFLMDSGNQPKIQDMSLDNYLTLIKLQEALKLPPDSLTRFVGNAPELNEQLGDPSQAISAYRKHKGGVCYAYFRDNQIHMTRTLEAIAQPNQYSLFDQELNDVINSRWDNNDDQLDLLTDTFVAQPIKTTPEDADLGILASVIANFNNETTTISPAVVVESPKPEHETISNTNESEIQNENNTVVEVEQPTNVVVENEINIPSKADIDATYPEVDASVIEQIVTKAEEYASEVPVSEPMIETNIENTAQIDINENNDFITMEAEQPTNETAITHDMSVKQISIDNEINTLEKIENPIEKDAAYINLVNNTSETLIANPDEQTALNFAKAVDGLLSNQNNYDLSQTFANIKSQVNDISIANRLDSIEEALMWKHKKSDELIPADNFIDKPYLSYYNVELNNNIANSKSWNKIHNVEKLDQIYHDFANNGGFESYIIKDVAATDFDNSFTAKVEKSKNGLKHITQIAQAVENYEVLTAIASKMEILNSDNSELVSETTRMMNVVTSPKEVDVAGKSYPINEIMKDEFLNRLPDIALNQGENAVNIVKLVIQGACMGHADPTRRVMVGEVLRGVQGLADNQMIDQSFVDNAYRDVASVLTGSALAHAMTQEEFQRYDIKLSAPQTLEYTREIDRVEKQHAQTMKI